MYDKPNKDNVYVTPRAFEYTYYLSDCISDSHEYLELLQLLDAATENDLVRIVINNCGGQAGTCVQLVDHVRNCRAPVIGVLSGNAFSAAGIIFAACSGHEVADHSMLMIHHAVGYVEGKYSDMTKYITAVNKRTRSLYEDVFEHFLTKEELDDVFKGEELWLTSEEVIERLMKRGETLQKEQESKSKQDQENLAQMYAELDEMASEIHSLPDWITDKVTKKQLLQFINGEIEFDIDEETKKITVVAVDNTEEA